MDHIFFGQIIHTLSINEIEIITDGYLAVNNGKIIAIGKRTEMTNDCGKDFPVIQLTNSQFLLPGFIDCHIHAPQMPNIGLGLNMDLLDWLQTYTFPLESSYTDLIFAQKVYEKVVKRTLSMGTTTACYFGTNDKDATKILVGEVIKQGQRALVGKVSANCLSPDYYVETTEGSLQDNIEFIEYVQALNNPMVAPIVTPRFALSCDMNLMQELSKIAQTYNLHIQSHISESLGEIQAIKETFQNNKNYADVYDEANLLTNKCIMAHSVHLDDEEIQLFKERGTSVAHCASSNINLSSGLCDVQRLIKNGITVGLGTDISGGNRVSILDAIRDTLSVSHTLEFVKKHDIKGSGKIPETEENSKYIPLNYKEALYLATLGGAKALSFDNKIGNFTVGKEFDALLIETNQTPIDQFELPNNINKDQNDENDLIKLLEKFLYVGDDRNIYKVYVNGKQVKN